MSTSKKKADTKRVLVAPGIYRRGHTFEVRVNYTDSTGRRRGRWATAGGSKREAIKLRDRTRSAANEGTITAVEGTKLTVAAFLTAHFLPYLRDQRVVQANRMSRNTYAQYERYCRQKVIPAIGQRRIAEINSGDIESLLNDLRVGGRNESAGMGRPRRYPDAVYRQIEDRHAQGATFADIAAELAAAHPGTCSTLTKNAVAAIWRRSQQPTGPTVPADDGLAVATVNNIRNMLRTAWKFGVKNELIPRGRAHVIAEAEPPQPAKNQPVPEIATWEPQHYSRFFDWAVDARPESWLALHFAATSGERISAVLGLRWSDVDLDAGMVGFAQYVKYHGVPGMRVLIEGWGKETAGHTISLDGRSVEYLRAEKARHAARLLALWDRHTCPTAERDCPLPGYHDRGLVFPQRDGNFRDPNRFLSLFQNAIGAYNRAHPDEQLLPVITLHGLRHGWTTHARAAGVDELVRMDRLDQRTPRVNRNYTKVLDDARRQAAQVVSDILFADSTRLGGTGC